MVELRVGSCGVDVGLGDVEANDLLDTWRGGRGHQGEDAVAAAPVEDALSSDHTRQTKACLEFGPID